ncbi:hypothetical protein [Streptomyces sp. NPDC049040]|uniref:hypothetical protein n=1 Tax=Streptomyces sp. NPDC049040 TaxID=3365593 RepID=UPI003719406C
MDDSRLPAGWTLQMIREVSGDRRACVLSADRAVRYLGATAGMDDEVLEPEVVLGFGDLCLVRTVGGEDWYMGSLYPDGSVDCWSAYDDLTEALRGL